MGAFGLIGLQCCVFGTVLASAYGWIGYAALRPLAAAVGIAECALVFVAAKRWRPRLRFGDFLRGGLVALLLLVLPPFWWEEDIICTALEGVLLDPGTAHGWKLMRKAPSFRWVGCPGSTDIEVRSMETPFMGQGYTRDSGVLTGPGFRLTAEAAVGQDHTFLIPTNGYTPRANDFFPFVMRARVLCSLTLNVPIFSRGRLEMPTESSDVTGESYFYRHDDEYRGSGVSQYVLVVLASRQSEGQLRSIAGTESRFSGLVFFLKLWTGLVLGSWTAVASALRPLARPFGEIAFGQGLQPPRDQR